MIGIEYIGYLSAASGLGVAARGYIEALRYLGVPIRTIDVTPYFEKRISFLPSVIPRGDLSIPIVRILHVNAYELPKIIRVLPPVFGGPLIRTIGIWAWETTTWPDIWRSRFALLDEIWCGSQFMASAISVASPIPVFVVPHVLMNFARHVPALHKSGRKKFFFNFDYKSVVERKNPLGVVDAFKSAFHKSDPVELVIKTSNSKYNKEYHSHLLRAVRGTSIKVVDEIVDTATYAAMLRDADVYVSLHRAEGFGLGIAEAMAAGKIVIATGYGGNMDYMNAENSIVVPYTEVCSLQSYGPYKSGTIWAEPDLDFAACKMRSILKEDHDLLYRLVSTATANIKEHCSTQAVASIMRKRLADFRSLKSGAHTVRYSKTRYFWIAEGFVRSGVRKIFPKISG